LKLANKQNECVLTLILPQKMPSATNFQATSKSFKVNEIIIRVSHPHPSCLHIGLWSRSVG